MKKFIILASLILSTGSAFAGSLTDKHEREAMLGAMAYSYETLGACATADLVKDSDTIIPLEILEMMYDVSSYYDPYHLSNTDIEYEWALASLQPAGDMQLAMMRRMVTNYNTLSATDQHDLKYACDNMLDGVTKFYDAIKLNLK